MINYKCIVQCIAVLSSLIFTVNARAQGSLNNQYVALYGASTGTTVPVDTWTIVNFDAKETDTANAVTTGSAWHFTAPDAAYLQIQTCVQWNGIPTGAGYYNGIGVFRNGIFIKMLDVTQQWTALGFSINSTLSGSTVVTVAANDTIDLRIYNHGPSSATTFNAPERCWVTVSRIK